MRSAHAALTAGDWRPAAVLLSAPGDRSQLVGMLTGSGAPTSTFRAWVDAVPDSTSLTMLAERLVADAWEIRGGGYADSVANDAWPRFHATLAEADAVVGHAVEGGNVRAEAWAAAVQIALALSRDIGVTQGRFERAHALVPFHASATVRFLQARCNKWQGTHEAMFSFARWASEHAPPSAPAQVAVVQAHHERWLAIADRGVASWHYMSQHHVRAEVVAVIQRFVAASPADGPAPSDSVVALNWFLWALGSVGPGMKPLAREVVRLIDGRVTTRPWEFWRGSTTDRFAQTAKIAMR